MSKRVIVVGGGVTGLAVAYEIRRRNPAASVTVLEKSPRPGGKVHTLRDRGFTVETGPDAFLRTHPAAVDLCRELGLGDDLIATNAASNSVYILSGGTLHPLPEGLRLVVPTDLGALRTSGLFSLRGQLRIALEPWVPRRKSTDDESLGALLGRRFGRQMVDRLAQPLLGGIYGGDVDRLSVGATFPDLARMERESGSLIRAARESAARDGPARESAARDGPARESTARDGPAASMQQRALGAAESKPPRAGSPFLSLRGGTEQLVDALRGSLGDGVIHTNSRVVTLGTRGSGPGAYVVTMEDGAVLECDDLVLAVPAPAAVTLAHGVAPHVARGLAGIKHVSTAVVSLGFREADVRRPLDGFGFLVARGEPSPVRGCTWSSTKFPGRAPSGHILLRAFLGGSGREADVARDDEELAALALAALKPLLELAGAPVLTHVARWPSAQPQYDVGHAERIAQIRAASPPGMHLVGASFDGVGIPACVDAGRRLGAALAGEEPPPAA